MSFADIVKRARPSTPAAVHSESHRKAASSPRGRDDHTPPLPSQMRGKKEFPRELTPKPSRNNLGLRRVSAPSPHTTVRAKEPAHSRVSPLTDQFDSPEELQDLERSKHRKPVKRRELSKSDVILRPPSKSTPSLLLSRFEDDNDDRRFTYAQVARTSISTAPAWAVTRTAPPTPVAVSPRKRPVLKRDESTAYDSDDQPSIFDHDEDRSEATSEITTDVSASVSELGLPPELNPDERLVNPEKYFADLEDLEAKVARHSALYLMKAKSRQSYPSGRKFALKFGRHGIVKEGVHDEFRNYDEAVMSYCDTCPGASPLSHQSQGNIGARPSKNELAFWAFHILECRNLMLATSTNMRLMQRENYCNASINALSVSKDRPAVARLVRVQTDTIAELADGLERALIAVVEAMKKASAECTELRKEISLLDGAATGALNDFQLPVPTGTVSKIRQTAMLLDLAVVSYAGAHIEPFDQRYIAEDLDYAKITTAWTYAVDGAEGVMLRKRSLRCLDSFLRGKRVLVFQGQSLWEDDQPLYLSTTIEEFADIWGPAWSVKENSDAETFLRYDTEAGYITAWPRDENSPPLAEDEVFCHWISIREGYNKPKATLNSDSRLLIGGCHLKEKTTSQLKENGACENKSNKALQQLHSNNLIEDLGTRPEAFILSEESVTAQISGPYIAVGGSKVYKRRSAVTLKDSICDTWKHGTGERNPAVLAHWHGVEVSFCSGNARRRRLHSMFNTTTMRRWLDACKTNAEPFDCEKAFQEAIDSADPFAFQELYKKHREWRDDLVRLVSWCLEGLRHSSVGEDGVLRALWLPRDNSRHRNDLRYRVKVKPSQHSWAAFLTDSPTKCTMAVISGRCFQTDYKAAARCQTSPVNSAHPGFTVLETALLVNDAAPMPRGLQLRPSEKERQSRWSISHLQTGESFDVSTGLLQVVESFARTRLVVEWKSGGVKKLYYDSVKQVTRMAGVRPRHHFEYKDQDFWPTKPVPLFIVSENECRR